MSSGCVSEAPLNEKKIVFQTGKNVIKYNVHFQGKYIGLLFLGVLYEVLLYWYAFNMIEPSEIPNTIGKFASSIVTIIATMPALELVSK